MVDIGSIGFDMSDSLTETPMSRTHQYRKVMKPMLERKRRARINKCLDELKDLMVHALQHEGESITKLEKADVLELTVKHLRKLNAEGGLSLSPSSSQSDKFRAGFRVCVGEITGFITSGSAGLDLSLSARLLQHLSICHQSLESSAIQSTFQNHPTSLHPELVINPLVRTLSDTLSGQRVTPGRLFPEPPLTSPSSRPPTVVKAELTVIPPSESETTWRPW